MFDINLCENAKYLGVQINSQLIFNSHIRMIENKILRSMGKIIKLKSFLPPTASLSCITHLYILIYSVVFLFGVPPTHRT